MARRRRRRGRGQAYFTKPLNKRRGIRQAKVAGRLATRPQRRAIKGEIRAERTQQRRIPDYFGQYRQAIEQAGTRSAQAYQQAGAQIGSTSKAASDYAEKLRQQLESEARENAELRGVAYDPQSSQTSVAANLARQNAANVLQGVVGAQGASQAALYADKSRIGEREKVEQLLRSAQRQRSSRQELRALGREEGDIRREELGRLRDAERDYRLGLRASRQPGKERRFEAREAARGRRFESREAARGRRFESRQAALDRRAGRRADRRGTPGERAEKRRGRQADRRETVEDIKDMVSLIRQTPKKRRRKLGKRGIIDQLATKQEGFSHREAKRAYRKYNRGQRRRRRRRRTRSPLAVVLE